MNKEIFYYICIEINYNMDSNEYYIYIGKIIKEGRVRQSYTQDDLGSMLGMTRVAINTIEAGRQKLPLHLVTVLSDVLQIPVTDLLPGSEFLYMTPAEIKANKIEIAISKINGVKPLKD